MDQRFYTNDKKVAKLIEKVKDEIAVNDKK